MSYTKEQISAALLLLKATGSPAAVRKTLGYPAVPTLYQWRAEYPEEYSEVQSKHWRQASNELKLDVIRRCFSEGESVQAVAEETGYSPSVIYKWYKCFQKNGDAFAKRESDAVSTDEEPSDTEDIEALKAKISEMQLEIDSLRETVEILKRRRKCRSKKAKKRKTV